MTSMDEFLFPGVIKENWQMMPWERIALTGVLARMRPKVSLEIGVYYGGSLSLTSHFVEKIYAIDIDPAVRSRFACPANADLIIGDSNVEIPKLLKKLDTENTPLELVLVDGDHSQDGVRRDLNLLLKYRPKAPMIILMHDSGNAVCREGIRSADWRACPFVHTVDLDFVPGQIIEHAVTATSAECWGGFAIAYLLPTARQGELVIQEGARTSIKSIHYASKNIGKIFSAA